MKRNLIYLICFLSLVVPGAFSQTHTGGGSSSSGGTTTSVTLVGTANQITVTGVGSCASTTVFNCQVSLPAGGTVVPTSVTSPAFISSGAGPWTTITERANNIAPAAGFDICDTDTTLHSILCSFNGAGALPIALVGGNLGASTTATTQAQLNGSTLLSTTLYTDTAVANGIAGVNPAIAVKVATVAAGDTSALTYNNGASGIGATFTGANNTATTIDGVTFTTTGQRLLVKNDTQSPSGAFNGIYQLTALHTSITGDIFTRVLDYDTPSDMNNTGAIPVQSGTANASTSWLMTAQIVTVGTTPLTFTQFSYAPNSCGGLPALTGNVTSSSGSCSTTVASVPAAALPTPTLTALGGAFTSPVVAFSLGGGAGNATTQNNIILYSMFVTTASTVSNLYYSTQTADNSANSYDVGAFGPGCLGGATSIPLAWHTGTKAGTTLAPSIQATHIALAAQVTLQPGWYCIGFTSSATSPIMKMGTNTSGNVTMFAGATSISGGGAALPSTITAPATSVSNGSTLGITLY